MGQLRSGILDLQKTAINLEPQITDLESQQDELSQQVYSAAKRIEEGLNTLVLYVMEKLKAAGKTFDSEAAKPLKDYLDSNVVTFGKGIVSAKEDVKKIIIRLNAVHKASVDKLLLSINTSANTAAKLKALCEKKKAKWLKSAKYKAKIGGYLAALAAIDDIFKRQSETIKGISSLNQNPAWVDRCYKFSQDISLKEVRALASSDLNTNLKDFTNTKNDGVSRARKFRDEYKSLGNQFAILKKWVDEADQMEAESEE